MIDLHKLQQQAFANKVTQGFNIADVNFEFNLLYGEVAEAFEAYRKKEHVGEELADVVIYILGLAQMLGIDIEDELQKKVTKNAKRRYETINGVLTRVEEAE